MSDTLKDGSNVLTAFLRRHLYMVLLLAGLALFGAQSFGCYLQSDDFRWVHRTVDDAGDPLSAFGSDLIWGDYYRPAPSLVWMLNYYVWGFRFGGYQAALICVWLASAGFVYAIGYRLGGRLAGAFAATLLGLNRTFLTMVSWKSWFSSLLEFMFLAAAVWLFLTARDTKRKGLYWAAGALAVAAAMSKEIAPLVAGIVVYAIAIEPPIRSDRWTPRRAAALAAWAALMLAVVLAMPSYRSAVSTLAGQIGGSAQPTESQIAKTASGETPSFSHAYFLRNLQAHLHYLYAWGLPAWAFVFLLVAEYDRTRHLAERLGPRRHYVVVGAFAGIALLGAIAFPLWSDILAIATGGAEQPAARHQMAFDATGKAALTILFVWVATRGRKRQRMLGLWFLVSFPPILFLAHRSAAYLLVPFAAVALYSACAAQRELQLETIPAALAAWRRKGQGREWHGRAARALAMAAVLGAVGWMLVANAVAASRIVRSRAESGRQARELTQRSVRAARVAFAGDEVFAAEGLSEIAGLLLRVRHGFVVRFPGYPEPDRRLLAVFRSPSVPLDIFRAIPLESAIHSNLVPKPRSAASGAAGYKGGDALLSSPPPGESRGRVAYVDRPGPGVVAFGAVMRRNPWIREASLVTVVENDSGVRHERSHTREVEEGWEQLLGSVVVGPNAKRLSLFIETRTAEPPEGTPYQPELRLGEIFLIPEGAPAQQSR